MKKLIVTLTVTAFAFGAFAGDACCEKTKAAAAGKACCAEKSAASCPASKAQCSAASKTARKETGKKVVHSPKGEQQANKS